ncbi:hypothetical protein G6F63_015610 [Rhizopus arrhizus]|nr:hypothetical protein G6F63_015610 [Rhizopus arrhizus]
MATKERDLAMAALDQVARGQVGTVLVVQGQEVPVGTFQFAVEQQHVGVGTQCLAQLRGITSFGRRQDQAGRRGDLAPARQQAAAPGFAVLGHVDDGAAVFPAHRETLHDAQRSRSARWRRPSSPR